MGFAQPCRTIQVEKGRCRKMVQRVVMIFSLSCLGKRADDGAGVDQPHQRRLRCGAAVLSLALSSWH